jgi:hypothetical protein
METRMMRTIKRWAENTEPSPHVASDTPAPAANGLPSDAQALQGS